MNTQRRKVLKGLGAAGAATFAQPYLSFPALAQNRPLRIGVIAPKAGIAGTIGECGLRGTLFAVDRINAAEKPLEEAIAIATEQVRGLRDIAHGVHIMPLGSDDAVVRILHDAGVA